MKNDDFERITNNKLFTHANEAVEYQKKASIKLEIANKHQHADALSSK